MVPGVLSAAEIAALATEIDGVFEALGPDNRAMTADEAHYLPFRYEMLNRSPLSQVAIARREILDVVEPLLGEDCHVIANTAWRQGAGEVSHHGGLNWHMDAGPHVPRPPGISWDQRIPYPVFAVACHIFLQDCPIECGPTGVIPRSHMSGQAPPKDRRLDDTLTDDGVGVLPILAAAGDVALFVSDVWHRRMPPQPGDPGRFFLQVHYGRRDIAQRLRTTDEVNQLSAGAVDVPPEVLAHGGLVARRQEPVLEPPGVRLVRGFVRRDDQAHVRDFAANCIPSAKEHLFIGRPR